MKRNQRVYTPQQVSLICKQLLTEDTVVFDTETTGLGRDAEIVELSIIDKTGHVLFDSLIKPERPIEEDAIAIHGITNEMVANAPSFHEVAQQVYDLMHNKNVVAHNIYYDRQRIEYEFSRLEGVDLPSVKSWACTMLMGIRSEYQKWPKLIEVANLHGIAFEGDAHRAIADAEVCRKVLIAYSNL